MKSLDKDMNEPDQARPGEMTRTKEKPELTIINMMLHGLASL